MAKGKGRVWLLRDSHITGTGRHLLYGITQCLLPATRHK